MKLSRPPCYQLTSAFTSFLLLWTGLTSSILNAERERIRMDESWQFALGHATDPEQDFGHATGYFSYLAKTGFGDGPASPAFDDRSWRTVHLPHDWAVEVPFHPDASHSHGYKALGPGFPENSVGWYRKRFDVETSELGKHFFIEFDGVFRDADVFINGFFVGNEPSGYLGYQYELTDYLNYGGENVLVVRVDASMEEGWFYEGAGIYRHVWLTKTAPLHFVKDGVWVNPQREDGEWVVHVQAEIQNRNQTDETFHLRLQLRDHEGELVFSEAGSTVRAEAGELAIERVSIPVTDPRLWSIEDPYLYEFEAEIYSGDGELVDRFSTATGFRTIRWDPDEGFFLNDKWVKLKGSNNHQDHAGVGAAIPDSLQVWRLKQLQAMGGNAYRAAHNPPTPELLDACDRLGILVIDETRLMGINDYHLSQLERLIRRDRNHPSVILWSLGNEEWAIESNIKGARITQTMQEFSHQLDPTRYTTVAISGGWGGVSRTVQVAGVNYIGQADPDQQHADYPEQIILGTEETTTQQTRGVYVRNDDLCHLPPLEDGSSKGNCEVGWKFYDARKYAPGVFWWTGFDYRGEPTPFGYPAISSQFGILDTCGFPKDSFYYLKSWWSEEPVLHLFPHWNWPDRLGETIEVRVHSNCVSAELFLNGQSQGKKDMEKNSHIAWPVVYEPGELRVVAEWADGSRRSQSLHTTGAPHAVALETGRLKLGPDRNEVAAVTVRVVDADGRTVPVSENLVKFSLQGPGSIIGVGNGNPSSHEPDVYHDTVWRETIGEWNPPNPADSETPLVWEAKFERPDDRSGTEIDLLFNRIGENQRILLNGVQIEAPDLVVSLESITEQMRDGENTLRIEASPFQVWRDREGIFEVHPVVLRYRALAPEWKRKVFNGLAQILIAAEPETGEIELLAESEGLVSTSLRITVENP